jgi:hypothetical protein
MTTVQNLTQEEETTLIRLMDQAECSSHFVCLSQEPEDRCEIRISHFGHVGECLDPDGAKCTHSLNWGKGLLCKCEMRLFIATAK